MIKLSLHPPATGRHVCLKGVVLVAVPPAVDADDVLEGARQRDLRLGRTTVAPVLPRQVRPTTLLLLVAKSGKNDREENQTTVF